MVAGARDFVVMPATGQELHRTIVDVHAVEQAPPRGRSPAATAASRLGTIVAVFGVKGGIGKSTDRHQRRRLARPADRPARRDAGPGPPVRRRRRPARPRAAAHGRRRGPRHRADGPPVDQRLPDAPRLAPPPAGRPADAGRGRADHRPTSRPDPRSAGRDQRLRRRRPSAQFDRVSMVALDLATIVLIPVLPEVTCVRRTQGRPDADAAVGLLQGQGQARRQPDPAPSEVSLAGDRGGPRLPDLRRDPGGRRDREGESRSARRSRCRVRRRSPGGRSSSSAGSWPGCRSRADAFFGFAATSACRRRSRRALAAVADVPAAPAALAGSVLGRTPGPDGPAPAAPHGRAERARRGGRRTRTPASTTTTGTRSSVRAKPRTGSGRT